jgi:hypothetical protein
MEFTETSSTLRQQSSQMPFDTNLRNTIIFLGIFILAFFPRSVTRSHKNQNHHTQNTQNLTPQTPTAPSNSSSNQ